MFFALRPTALRRLGGSSLRFRSQETSEGRLPGVGLFFADGFYHKHGEVTAEYLFGFYGVYGFIGCVALVLAAKWLRTVVMRSEDYYDRDD